DAYDRLKNNFWGKIFKSEKYLADKKLLDFAISRLKNNQMKDCLVEIKNKYNQAIVELMQKTPLTKDEQDRLLSADNIAKMNLADYLSLANRLSGLYFSHVTRFGLRETVGVHCGGQGQVIDGFKPILESGRLGSLVDHILSKADYAKIYIREDLLSSYWRTKRPIDLPKDEAVKMFMHDFFNRELFAACPKPDCSATHFGYNHILEDYGAEAGYTIYFYFPVEVIAKNFQHNLNPEHPRSSQKDQHNDQVAWSAGEGIPLDLGVVCIPENVPVDKASGSKYVLDKNRQPTVCSECRDQLTEINQARLEFNSALTKIRNDYWSWKESGPSLPSRDIEFFDRPEVIELARKFGFIKLEEQLIRDDREYAYGCLPYSFSSSNLFSPQHPGGHGEKAMAYFKANKTTLFKDFVTAFRFDSNEPADQLLSFYLNSEIYQRFPDKNIFRLFLERPSADNTISSKEYWENYFNANPQTRPSKILYYDRTDMFTGPDFKNKPLLKTEYYAINEDNSGAHYKELISQLRFKDTIPGTQEFFDKYNVDEFLDHPSYRDRDKYLAEHAHYPSGYLDFW
ncbi:MAG TPA: hypothetical protein PKK32_02315, partial [Candidatus Paceibacterota bacterium]|nr:hypothetical protein [Candidatus Paceibacterota bacterium]HQC46375.1 hypothetical protein [Candidatus Paceibacterota bacterium]